MAWTKLLKMLAAGIVTAGVATMAEAAGPESGLSPLQVAQAAPAGQPEAFAFTRFDIDTSNPQPEACFTFSRPLATEGVRYGDYLRFRPAVRAGVSVRGQRLCITGLAYGREYDVDLLPGLPGIGGALARGETVKISLGDRPSVVSFASTGVILPRTVANGLPLTTINVDEVGIRVYRAGERGWTAVRQSMLYPERRISLYSISDIAEDKATLVWSGTLATKGERNQSTITAFPLGEVLKERKPGVYWIVAWNPAEGELDPESGNWRMQVAAQWVIESDLALSTFRGDDGMTVVARSLETAKPVPGVKLTLVSRGNDELAAATTDGDGKASFAAGLLRGTAAAAAAGVMAFGENGDYMVADLSRPAFDLSDRGVEGRAMPGPVDAFAWTERGIYRPAETVQLMAMLRDRAGRAIPDTPAIVVVRRPDGIEFQRFPIRSGATGALYQPIVLSPSAKRGMWTADIMVDPAGAPAGRISFEVQDFVPQRLKLALKADKTAYAPAETLSIDVEARFLYGAPAAGLDGNGEATIEPDPEPWPAHRAYSFGLVEERVAVDALPIEVETTDEQGRTKATAQIPDLASISRPLKATARVSIFEPGGRSTDDQVELKIRTRPHAIGLRPLFRDGRVGWDSDAGFEVILVDRDGRRVAGPRLPYTLIREETTWQWYSTGSGWRYEPVSRERVMAEGRIDVGTDGPAELRVPVQWGRYRLVLREGTQGGAATSLRFYAGWASDVESDRTPDKLEISTDKPAYRPNETARIKIEAPFAGEALIALAGHRVYETRNVTVPEGTTEVSVPVSADWGPGAYALVTLVRPLATQGNRRSPVRAIGVAWLGVDPAERSLSVAIQAPDVVRPRQTMTLPIRVSGTAPAGGTFLTVAAVDEGILQLTKFQNPDPVKHYFGKRRLGVELRDDYGRLIDGRMGLAGAVRQGGDAAALGGAGLEVVPTRTVALFSGPVQTDAGGLAQVQFDVPDFTGELRLMAVAWDAERVGAGAGSVRVRDAVASDAVFPRFLAPGDRSRVVLNLHNLEGQPGTYQAAWTIEGPVQVDGNPSQSVTLAAGERQLLIWPLVAGESGIAILAARITGPGGFDVTHEWRIQVRPAQAPVTTERVERMAPGATLRLDRTLTQSLIPSTASVVASVAGWRGFDVPGLLRALDRYPYGCLEQTTSRAMPLLFVNDMALLGRSGVDQSLDGRVQDAIWRILDMQSPEGGFGMWGPYRRAYAWLEVFAIDFLIQAKAKGRTVPDDALRRAMQHLRRIAEGSDRDDDDDAARADRIATAKAYALFVLAREGQVDIGRLRYVHDREMRHITGAFGLGHMAAALTLAGDRSRAANAFALASRAVGRAPANDYYGSALRDMAGLVSVSAETRQDSLVQALFDRIGALDRIPAVDATTTQERAWMLMASYWLSRGAGPVTLEVNGQRQPETRDRIVVNPDADGLGRGVVLRNAGDREAWARISTTGVPREMLPPTANGVTIQRSFYTLTGDAVDLARLTQNDRVVVSLEGQVTGRLKHELVILDLLPAGFEIEAVVQREEGGSSRFSFLSPLSATAVREARDDRFVAAVNIRDDGPYSDDDDLAERGLFHVAYIVRAITPGSYVLPAASVEDMYRPAIVARSAAGRVAIAAR